VKSVLENADAGGKAVAEGKSGAVRRMSIALTVVNAIVVVVSVGAWLALCQKFAGIFVDFGVELPAMTKMCLSISATLWTLWPIVVLVLLALLVAKEFIARKWIPLSLNLAFILLAGVYWRVFITAMCVPLLRILDDLQGN
jgi:type II secretory pathway component PulF